MVLQWLIVERINVTMVFVCRYLREEGKALVTQATDEQSQQTNAVTYIQVCTYHILVLQ